MSAHDPDGPVETPVRIPEHLLPPKEHGLDTANCFSVLTWSWVARMLEVGQMRPLQAEDLDPISYEDRGDHLQDALTHAWANQLMQADQRRRREQLPASAREHVRAEPVRVLAASQQDEINRWVRTGKGATSKLLLNALATTFFPQFIILSFLNLVYMMFSMAQPLLLKEVVAFVESFQDGANSQPVWEGYAFAFGLGMAALCQGFTHHQYFFRAHRLGARFRVALSGLIYRKALALNAASFLNTTTGQLVNLVANDVHKFEEGMMFFPYLLGGPLQVIITIVLLWQEVGVASLCGVGVLFLLVPLQSVFSNKFGAIRKVTISHTDKRIKTMNEILVGAEVVKLYNWEGPLEEVVKDARSKEFASLRKAASFKAINVALFFPAMIIVMFTTFSVDVALLGNSLTPGSVFATVALFNSLRYPVTMFIPLSVEKASECRVTLSRVAKFLALDVSAAVMHSPVKSAAGTTAAAALRKKSKKKGAPDALPVVSVSNASFSWSAPAADDHVEVGDAAVGHREQTVEVGDARKEDVRVELTSLHGNKPTAGVPSANGAILPSTSSTVGLLDGVTSAVLQNISLHVKSGELYAVVGPIGAGKSSLLTALLGELNPCDDAGNPLPLGAMRSVRVTARSVALAPQKAWIVAATVRDNIVFGRPYDEERYRETIKACQLTSDLELLHSGDQTQIGERGVNLSGGQKARVSLARAVYSPVDLYLLDDPLSAVDAVVARRIFDEVLGPKGLLRRKHPEAAIVLVTHQRYLLPEVNRLCVLHRGTVQFEGTFAELQRSDMDVEALLEAPEDTDQPDDADGSLTRQRSNSNVLSEHKESLHHRVAANASLTSVRTARTVSNASAHSHTSAHSQGGATVAVTQMDSNGVVANDAGAFRRAEDADEAKNLVQKETKQQGTVSWAVYSNFLFKSAGYIGTILVMVAMVAGQVAMILSDGWLALWSDASPSDQRASKWVEVYAALAFTTLLISAIRSGVAFQLLLFASRTLHNNAFRGVLYSPLRFFEANPVGRVLNRFSKDQAVLDELLPLTFYDTVQSVFMVVGTLIVVLAVNIWTALSLLPICFLFVKSRSVYLASSREVKRLEANARSVVYAHFSATLSGLVTVRAFHAQQRFEKDFMQHLDANTKCYNAFMTTTRWLGFRLDFISCIVVLSASVLAVAARDTVDPGAVGFSLAYSIALTGLFQWSVRQSAELENQMTSTERLIEYSQLPPEGTRVNEHNRPPKGWPSQGKIELDHIRVRYRPELDDVLRDVHAVIQPREKVGVIGRTGAGKSSLFGAIFRLVHTVGGTIRIDDVDVHAIGLADLRSQLAIIPQNPVIFSETLRYNLDPFKEHDDKALWEALTAVELRDMVASLPEGLMTMMAEYGSNFSVGEAQLVCVARAILKPSALLFIDEATASVDRETDQLIQRVIRDKFRDRTVVTIAHRLDTIADCDKIMVLDHGQLIEFDTPTRLLNPSLYPNGLYRTMLQHTEEAEEEAEMKQ